MRKSGKGSGGGLGMNKNVRPGYRTGVGARGVNKNWPAQIGRSVGSHITQRGEVPVRGIRAEPYKGPSFKPVPLGNELAPQVKCGPGGSREIIGKSGAQAQHGAVNPGAPDRPSTKGQWPDAKR